MEEPKSTIPMNSMSSSHVANISQNYSSEKDLIEDEQDSKKGNIISRQIVLVRKSMYSYTINHSVLFSRLFKTMINLCLIAYTIAAVVHWYNNGQKSLDWCRGSGMLLILLTFTACSIIYYKLLKPFILSYIKESCCSSSSSDVLRKTLRISKIILLCVLGVGLVAFLIIDTVGSRRRLVSAGGIFVFILLGLIFSKHPNQIKWKTVIMGIFVQVLLGLLIIRWEVGRSIFTCIGDRVDVFLRFGHEGAAFVYGELLVSKLHVFAFQSMAIIYFLSMVIEVCFYFGWIQVICFKLGSLIQIILGTTIIESVNAVTTVFLGLSEAPLLYKPYIKDLTSSEMHAVMAGGLSTAAGTVFAAYTALGVNPAYIITASVMSAPAALCFAKLLYPETDSSKTSIRTFVMYKSEERSVVDAACKGAISAVNLVMAIIAIVLACVSLVAFFNSTMVWFATMIGIEGFTFEYVVGKLLIPIPYIMGVSPEQCDHVARLVGIKVTLNEFIAYSELGKLKKANLLTPRSEAMATFALCSFSNPGGLASFIAILVSLAPSQKEKVTAVSIRAFISGITTGLLTASIAGALMPEEGFGECLSCVTTLSPNATTIQT